MLFFFRVIFSPLSIVITSLGEGRANLSALHTFVRLALVLFSLFPAACTPWTSLLPFSWLWHSLDFSRNVFDNLSQLYSEQNKDIELKDLELSTNCPIHTSLVKKYDR